MSVSRRSFLKSAMAAFAGAVAPLSHLTFQAPIVEAREEPVKLLLPKEPQWQVYNFDWYTAVGRMGTRPRLLARSVAVRFPTDPELLSRHPAEICFSRLMGPLTDVRDFLQHFEDIANREKLVFALSAERSRLADTFQAFIFDRPVLVGFGPLTITNKTLIDAYGENGGAPVQIPDADRMAMVEGVQLRCRRVPTKLRDFEAYRRSHPLLDYETSRPRCYTGREARGLSPAEYDALLKKAADANRDEQTWARAQGELKGFDPAAFGKRRTIRWS